MRGRGTDVVIAAVLVTLLTSQLCSTTAVDDEQQRARDWLEQYYGLVEQRWYSWFSANWDFNVNITDENRQRVREQSKLQAEFSKRAFANLSQFNWQNFTDRDLRRQFWLLSDLAIDVLLVDEVLQADRLGNEMRTVYSTATLCGRPADVGTDRADNCYVLNPDVTRIMATSRDWEELKWAWREWRSQTGRKMKESYREFAELHNKAARMNGFSDNGEYWRSSFETEGFREKIEQLWQQVRPLYEQLHAYVRRRLKDAYPQHRDLFPATGHIPAHITGNMWAQGWPNIIPLVIPYANQSSANVTKELVEQGYNTTAMFELADQFFLSLGLEAVPPLFWKNSMLEKPTDGREVVCHASAWDFFNGKDFRIKQCTDVTSVFLMTTHHEMGHVQYYLMYRHQPIAYRKGANPGFHEAVGDVISLSVNTPEHLQKIGLIKDFVETKEADINFLMAQALEKIAFLPFGYLIDKWRWGLFEGATTSDNYNTEWWKLRCSLQGISPPATRSNEDFDAGSKFHVPNNTPYIRYFVSYIIQFQFHKALCEAAGVRRPLHRCDIYESREAGDLLRRTLELGSSKPWPEAMEVMTGQRQMDAGPLLEYFQPLHDWLRQQNAGYDVTWDAECPPGSLNGTQRLAAASSTCALFVAMLAQLVGVLLLRAANR